MNPVTPNRCACPIADTDERIFIRFRPSPTVRPDLTATRAGERLEFYDIESVLGKVQR